MQVDIYDFDKTVVPFDSALKYWGFCMVHNPWIILLLPFQFIWGMMMLTHIISVRTCKKVAFLYIRLINNEKNVKKYWDKYEKYVYDWFKPENRKRTTVIISASPDFLIEEIARRMNVDYVICTTHDRKHGIMRSEVCRHAEKVRRFREVLPDAEVMDVYSDSIKSDRYIFALGKRDFLVTKGKIEEFNLDEKLKEILPYNKKKRKHRNRGALFLI